MKRLYAVGVSLSWLACQTLAAADFDLLQKKIGVPKSIGSIVDAAGENPRMILIQDVHRHPEAQQNIAAMIIFGLRHWGAKEVLVEGAWDEGDSLRNGASQFPSLRQAVREGKLGGAEMAVAMAPDQNFRFLGLEDPEIYRQNVEAYEAVVKTRDSAMQELETGRLLERIFDTDTAQPTAQVKRLIELRMKPQEYAAYARNPCRPSANTNLAVAIRSAEHYYELANRRSKIFLASARRLHREGAQVLVIGGFHTQAMAQALREAGVSFVVLSPRITRGGYDELYEHGMHETVSALKLQ